MTLYEIDSNIAALLTRIDPDTGEIPDEVLQSLDQLEMDRKAKIAAVVAVIRNNAAQADIIGGEIERLKKMRAACTGTVDRLKDYVADSLRNHGERSIDCGSLGKPRLQRNGSPSISLAVGADLHELPARFRRIKLELDAGAIQQAFKLGEELPKEIIVVQGEHLRLG